ncbi:SMI1/KNR4 family protein [Lacinutrix salivirga]
MKYLNKVKQKLDEWQTIYKGCAKGEIIEIIEIAGGSLPECYLEFLSTMGKDMDRKEIGMRGFLVGNAVFYEDLFDNKEGMQELLDEDGRTDLILTDNDFVFYDSQGIIQAFFKLDEGDNPPVYGYEEGYKGGDFPKIADSLSSFYERYLESDKTLFSELRV